MRVGNSGPVRGGGTTGTTYAGRLLGGFTSTNKIQSAANQLVDFRPGMTLWLVLQVGAIPVGTEYILGCTDPTTHVGWTLRRQGGTGTLYLIQGNLASYQALMTPAVGIHVLCLVWKTSDTTINASIDGGPFTSYGAVTAPAATATTWRSGIGTPLASDGCVPFASGGILAFATWATEATSTQAVALTFSQTNRFAFPTSITASAVVDCDALRDWDGSAASILTHGSSPITYAVSGAPSWTKTDELRVATSATWLFDGSASDTYTDGNGYTYTVHDSYSYVRALTDASVVYVEAYSGLAAAFGLIYGNVGMYVNGAYSTQQNVVSASTPQVMTFAPGSSLRKIVELWEGACAVTGSTFPCPRTGTTIQAVRVPLYLSDGLTSTNTTMISPSPPQKRLVILGDSIAAGFYSTIFEQLALCALLRADYPTSGTGRVTMHAAGSDSIGNVNAIPGFAALLASELDGTQSNDLWIQLSTNDYGANAISVANFTAYYGALLDVVHALRPTARIWCQSAFQRIAPSSEAANGFGSTLGAYRTAISTVVSTRTAYATYVEGAAGAIVGNANMYTDGLHLTDAAYVQYKAFIKSTLGY